MSELERCGPSLVQQASSKARGIANKVPEVARSVASEVQCVRLVDNATGLAKAAVAKYEPKAKEIYAKYEPMAEHYAVKGWGSLNRIPLFAQVAHIVVLIAAHLFEKYNGAVCMGREKGYSVAAYLPCVPVEKIGKLFGPPDAAADRVVCPQ